MAKITGTWWNDRNIELVEIDGRTYALNGWNGETYENCWECTGKYNMDASGEYRIRPIYEEIEEDEYDIVDYELV